MVKTVKKTLSVRQQLRLRSLINALAPACGDKVCALKYVADKTGTSVSTVQHARNGHELSDFIIDKILKVIK